MADLAMSPRDRIKQTYASQKEARFTLLPRNGLVQQGSMAPEATYCRWDREPPSGEIHIPAGRS